VGWCSILLQEAGEAKFFSCRHFSPCSPGFLFPSACLNVSIWYQHMIMKVVIRKATTSDIEDLVNLLEILFSIEEDFTFNAAKHRRGLTMMLTDLDTRCVVVAEVAQSIVGMCSVQTVVSSAEGGKTAWVEDVVIQKAFQGQGIGRKLLSFVEEWCTKQGIERIQLLADHNNQPALEFYKKLSWQKTQLICLRKFI
jgi:ribosomal protein S18 acetylase RimI-like enzyme